MPGQPPIPAAYKNQVQKTKRRQPEIQISVVFFRVSGTFFLVLVGDQCETLAWVARWPGWRERKKSIAWPDGASCKLNQNNRFHLIPVFNSFELSTRSCILPYLNSVWANLVVLIDLFCDLWGFFELVLPLVEFSAFDLKQLLLFLTFFWLFWASIQAHFGGRCFRRKLTISEFPQTTPIFWTFWWKVSTFRTLCFKLCFAPCQWLWCHSNTN